MLRGRRKAKGFEPKFAGKMNLYPAVDDDPGCAFPMISRVSADHLQDKGPIHRGRLSSEALPPTSEKHIDLTHSKAASSFELPAVRDRPIQSRVN